MKAVRFGRNSSSKHTVNNSINHAASGTVVDQLEDTDHPFIVKVWLEEKAHKSRGATWRGHITHVPSGNRHYLADLQDIVDFIAPYLQKMGVRLGMGWRVSRWLKRVKLFATRSG